MKVRTGSGLGREDQVFRPGQEVIWGGRDRYPRHDRQWPGEGGTGDKARTGSGLGGRIGVSARTSRFSGFSSCKVIFYV